MVNAEFYREEIVEYRKWLEQVRPEACKRFLQKIDSSNITTYEGAIAEAVGWCWLGSRCKMELFEDESYGGIDFRCTTEHGHFYAEVTALTSDKISRKTGLDNDLERGASHYTTATGIIKHVVSRKASQQHPKDASYIVFVVGLHLEFRALLVRTDHLSELLIGSEVIRANVDLSSGEVIGAIQSVATLDHALFFERDSVNPARCNISGVLVGGFGGSRESSNVLGLLNQNAARPYNREHIPDVCFGQILPWPIRQGSTVKWARADDSPCDDDAERERHRFEAEKRLRATGHGELLDQIQDELGREKRVQ